MATTMIAAIVDFSILFFINKILKKMKIRFD